MSPLKIGREVGPGGGRALGVIEQAVALAEHEVVLVPEAVLDLGAEVVRDRVVDDEVVLLGPGAHELQRRPVVPPIVGLGGDPGIVRRRLRRQAPAMALSQVHAGLVEERAGLARAVMRDERHLPRGGNAADIEEMVAVALRAEMLARGIGRHGEKAVGAELLHQRLGDMHVMAVGPAATTEVGELHAGIENRDRVDVAEHGDRHRAADVGRMHAGMDRLPGRDDAADRDRSGRGAGRAGIGHDGAGNDGRHAHQLGHVPLHRGEVLRLMRILGADVEPMGERAAAAQLHRRGKRRRREPVDDGADGGFLRARPSRLLGRRNRRSEPRAGRVAPRDQGLARNRRHDYCALETLSSAMDGHDALDLPEPRRFGLLCR